MLFCPLYITLFREQVTSPLEVAALNVYSPLSLVEWILVICNNSDLFHILIHEQLIFCLLAQYRFLGIY